MALLAKIDVGTFYLLRLVYQHRLKALLLVIATCAAFIAANLPHLQKDGRVEAFMHENDPALSTYYKMRQTFGQDNRLVIVVSAPDVFDAAFLKRFAEMHQELARKVPFVSEIFSPFNIPFIKYENGGVYLEEMVRNMLARGRDPGELRNRIIDTPLYQNFIVSKDGKTVSIVIEPYRYAPSPNDCIPDPSAGRTCRIKFTPPEERPLLGTPQYMQMSEAAREIAARYESDDFKVYIAGAPVVSTEIVKMMEQDLPRFTLLCVLITMVTMLVLYRSILIAIGALAAFILSILTTFASISAFGFALTPPTQLLIPMTLVVVLCTYIHSVSALLNARRAIDDGVLAIKHAVEECNTPILFTALTTAGGLVGFIVSPLAPITALGLFGLVSISVSYLFALFWSTIVFRSLSPRYFSRRQARLHLIPQIMGRIAAACAAAPGRTLVIALIAIGTLSVGVYRLDYSHNSLLWLPPDNPARQSTEIIDGHYNGTVNLEMVITPRDGRDFRDETLLNTLETSAREAYDIAGIPIGRHTSIISFLEELNQAIHGGDRAHLRLPDQKGISQELLLLEGQGTDDVKRYVSMDYAIGRVSFQTPWLEAKKYTDVITNIEDHFRSKLGDLADVQATGLIALLAKTSKAVLDSMVSSYIIDLILIAGMMCIVLRSIQMGLLSMVPNILPLAALLGAMGYLSLPLDTFSVLIGGIIMGLLVDDTLHTFHRINCRLRETDDAVSAVRLAMHDTGGAICSTTCVMIASFSVFMLSGMSNLQIFGMLMVIGAAIGLVTEITIAPAVVALWHRFRVGFQLPAPLVMAPQVSHAE